MKKKSLIILALVLCVAIAVGAVLYFTNSEKKEDKLLDPSHPVSLTVWHYYNGAQQAAFEELINRFNATVGKDMGIYVQGYSQGSVKDLEAAVVASAEGVIGADKLPDIFSTYADTAYTVQNKTELVDLRPYFTDEELSKYVQSYVNEGYFNQDDHLYLFPVAKSTEIFMMNKTDWEPFAAETGSTLDELSTLEGVVKVAERYYNWTDAKTPDVPDDGAAFYGRDSMSNYFIIGMKQMGEDIFSVKDGKVTVCTDKEKLRRLWDNYYVPYVKGYFAAYGKFRSDDVKTGDLLCYTGSSSSAMYFPDYVEMEDDSKEIDYQILPAPIMEGGENICVQQGAGVVVTKSDEQRQYAASVFLKWFTQPENSLMFVCESSYMPVRIDARNKEVLDRVIADNNLNVNSKAYDCLEMVIEHTNNTTGYTTPVFENGSSARRVLDDHLANKAKEDKADIDAKVAAGESRSDATAPYLTDEAFDAWYADFCTTLVNAAEGK